MPLPFFTPLPCRATSVLTHLALLALLGLTGLSAQAATGTGTGTAAGAVGTTSTSTSTSTFTSTPAPVSTGASAPAEAAAPELSSRVAGLWCGDGLLSSYTLRLSQQAQAVSGTIHRREKQWPITGHMDGAVLTTDETPVGTLVLQREGQALRLVGGKGPIALASGTRFTAAQGGQCGKA